MIKIFQRIVLLAFFIGSITLFAGHAHAAANLTLSSGVLASDGKTLTATISGGTGTGYAPATGITSLTPKITTSGGATYPIASTSISGTTLTVVLAAFIPQGETVTLNINASSNLTDSGANTATGGTLTATNNSTVSVSKATATNSAISYYGRVTHGTGTGNAYSQLVSAGTDVVFVVNGTDAIATVFSTVTGGFSVSIDGGASTTLTLPAINVNVTVPLFSGLSAGEHTVELKRDFTGNFYLYTSNAILTAGGTGVYRSASTADGVGYGPYLRLGDAGFSATGNTDNLNTFSGGAYFSPFAYTTPWQNPAFRVRAKTSTLKLWTYLNGSTIAYSVDGVSTGTTVLPNTSNWGLVTIATGLDSSAEHLYGFTANIGLFYVDAVMLVGSGASYSSTPVGALPGIGGFGDSITSGTGANPNQNWLYRTAFATQQTPYNRGVSGSTVISSGQTRTADITAISPAISKNFILYGTNDIGAASGGSPTSGFSTAYQAMLTSMLSGTTSTTHYIMGILPRSTYANSVITDWNALGNGVQGSIAAVKAARPADAARLIYIDTSTWKMNGADGTDFTTNYADGLHPNSTGYALMANRLIPYASTAAYAVTGPSSGVASAASTNFTVTIASGATFTGDQTVTISDGINGGTITPSVGSAGVSSVVVTPVNGATSFTFTYIPASSGTKTLSFANGQNWTDVSSVAYTASTAPDTTAPVRSAGSPSSTLPANTVQTTLALSTDEAATCRYSSNAGVAYTSMTGVFSTTGSTTHSTSITGLSNGTSYSIYVRCSDTANNVNTSDYSISFTVAAPSGGGGFTSGGRSIVLPSDCTGSTVFSTSIGIACTNYAGTVESTPSVSSNGPVLMLHLQLRSNNQEVRLLQQYLNTHGYVVATSGAGSRGNETTYFGRATKAAVIGFQQAHGLQADGIIGAQSRLIIRTNK